MGRADGGASLPGRGHAGAPRHEPGDRFDPLQQPLADLPEYLAQRRGARQCWRTPARYPRAATRLREGLARPARRETAAWLASLRGTACPWSDPELRAWLPGAQLVRRGLCALRRRHLALAARAASLGIDRSAAPQPE